MLTFNFITISQIFQNTLIGKLDKVILTFIWKKASKQKSMWEVWHIFEKRNNEESIILLDIKIY